MFHKNLLSVVAKMLGSILVLGWVVFFISGFFVASLEGGESAAERAGYFIGYEVAGLAMFGFLFLLVGAMHRVSQRES